MVVTVDPHGPAATGGVVRGMLVVAVDGRGTQNLTGTGVVRAGARGGTATSCEENTTGKRQ